MKQRVEERWGNVAGIIGYVLIAGLVILAAWWVLKMVDAIVSL